MKQHRIDLARRIAVELEWRHMPSAAGIMRELIREVTKGCNSEKHTEDIGSGPGCVIREDARRIMEWRDDIDNTVFPVDLVSAACRLAANALKD